MPTIRTSVVPDLLAALFTTMTTTFSTSGSGFEQVAVLDGPHANPGAVDTLQIGVADPDSTDLQQAATTAETPGPLGTAHPRNETGSINITATSWNGGRDVRAARERVAAIAAQVATLARASASTSWGVNGVLWTHYATASNLLEARDENGARAALTFRLYFRARI